MFVIEPMLYNKNNDKLYAHNKITMVNISVIEGLNVIWRLTSMVKAMHCGSVWERIFCQWAQQICHVFKVGILLKSMSYSETSKIHFV